MSLKEIPEYRLWKAMRWRCSPRNPSHDRYFDRGITVCSEWDNYDNFYKDMGERPTKKHTLDRIDNNKGYEPGNCRWATYKQQANNTHRTNFIELNGRRITLMEIADSTGIHPETLRARIRKGWSYERITAKPTNAKNRRRDQYGQFI